MANLPLVGTAGTDDRLLDEARRVLGDRQAGMHDGRDGGAAGLPELERRTRVPRHEDLLDSSLDRRIIVNNSCNALENLPEALAKWLVTDTDAAAGDVPAVMAIGLDHAIPGVSGTRVDTKDTAHRVQSSFS